jgi:hypothetical protein
MYRRAAIGLAASLLGLTGCFKESLWPDSPANAKPVKTPKTPAVTPASQEVAKRVDDLVRLIIDRNTFTGLDPVVMCIGVPESVLFHRGPAELFVSEGLVKQCKTDADLAAVLCSELGQMQAELRAARGVGRENGTIPELGLPGGGPGPDPVRQAELATREKRRPGQGGVPPDDPAKLARELLRCAGFDPADLDRVQPLLKQSERGDVLRKQMAGSAKPPEWQK